MPAVSPIQFDPSHPRQGSASPEVGVQEALRSANLANYYLRTALDQSNDGVLILRPGTDSHPGPKVIYSNQRMAFFAGMDPRTGLRGAHLRDLLVSDEDYQGLMTALHQAYRNGGGGEWQGNLKSFMGQGQSRYIWRIRAVQNEFGLLQNYTLTISPTKLAAAMDPALANQNPAGFNAAEELRRQRNDQLAAMSQGVMHDLNNLLGIIMTNLSAISDAGTDDTAGAAAHHIKEALAAAIQAREFTSQTLRLAKDVPPTHEPVNVVQLVKTATRIAQSGSGVRLHMHMPEDLWWTMADRTSFARVIQNLVINGIQAMNNTGTMEINAKNVVAPEGHSMLQPGPHVEIIVSDHGCGMTPDVLERVMKESYTTKANGNGIGLATCRRVIEEHGGKMHISTLVGVGTQVYLWMPACPAPQEETQKPQTSPEPSSSSSLGLRPGVGSVLVVDDEDRLRQIIVTVLTKCGYQVYEAQDGLEAIDIYRRLMRQNQEVDLVVMDLTLKGGLSGEEALHGIKELNPNARVVASSGGLVPQTKDQYLQLGFCDILPKPYLAPDISNLVHKWVIGR